MTPSRPARGAPLPGLFRIAAAFVAAAVLGVGSLAHAADPTFPALTGRVVDDAHVLTPAVVSELTQRSAQVEQQSGRQMVVATVPSLQGLEIEDYGYRLGRAWGIGEKGKSTGAILLVAPTERKVRVEVGYGLEGDITDALSSVIVNQKILPRFRAGDIPGGVQAGGDALADLMALPSDQLQQKSAAAAAAPREIGRSHARGGFPIIFVVFLMIWLFSAVFRGRGRYGRGGGGVGSWLPWVILGAMSGRGGRDDDWGGGGGGFGGGGFGGGGGGFSGGGGSFGGGGASGSW